jgi:hypothetical protein
VQGRIIQCMGNNSLVWKKRCKKDRTDVSDRRIWESKCNCYKVIHSHIFLGNGAMPDAYYAIVIEEFQGRNSKTFSERIISRHRKKNPAIKSCENHFKKTLK